MQTRNTITAHTPHRARAIDVRAMRASHAFVIDARMRSRSHRITRARIAHHASHIIDDDRCDALSRRRVRTRYDVMLATIVFRDIDVTLRVPRMDAR
jgi:hypothetical protein